MSNFVNFEDLNHVVENCSFCHAQVLAMNYASHVEWHNAQHEILDNLAQIVKALAT